MWRRLGYKPDSVPAALSAGRRLNSIELLLEACGPTLKGNDIMQHLTYTSWNYYSQQASHEGDQTFSTETLRGRKIGFKKGRRHGYPTPNKPKLPSQHLRPGEHSVQLIQNQWALASEQCPPDWKRSRQLNSQFPCVWITAPPTHPEKLTLRNQLPLTCGRAKMMQTVVHHWVYLWCEQQLYKDGIKTGRKLRGVYTIIYRSLFFLKRPNANKWVQSQPFFKLNAN